MRVTFRVIDGPHLGARYTFEEHASFVVGRHRKTQFRLSLKDPYLSRFHFYIDVAPPICALVDLGSTNKTYVNGEPVRRVELTDGDRIKAGHTTLLVGIEEPDAAPEAPTRIDPSVLPVLANYQIERELGAGSAGRVFLAVDRRDGSRVALKTVDSAAAGTLNSPGRFEREADLLKKLQHPNIIGLYEVGRAERWLYLAMEYQPGVDGFQMMRRRRGEGLAIREAVGLVSQILAGLGHAHRAGVVHRDVKPGNFLIGPGPDGHLRAKLGDFGLARLYQGTSLSALTETNTILGSLGFMAPEQIIDPREAAPAADLYGAGASLFYFLTGKSPHELPDQVDDCLKMILHEEPRPIRALRPDVPVALARAVEKALAFKPEDRYIGADDFREALAPWSDRLAR